MATAPWTLAELVARTRAALATDYPGVANHQAADIPNARAIRWYTQLGLVDRPSSSRGPTALYGPRHLRQIVAIKRLQAEGLTLAEVQAQLAGVTEGQLTEIARVSDDVLRAKTDQNEVATGGMPRPTRRARTFWSDEPVPPVLSVNATVSTSTPLQGVALHDGLTLTFPTTRPLTPGDLDALRAALEPVRQALRARGLVPRREGERSR